MDDPSEKFDEFATITEMKQEATYRAQIRTAERELKSLNGRGADSHGSKHQALERKIADLKRKRDLLIKHVEQRTVEPHKPRKFRIGG